MLSREELERQILLNKETMKRSSAVTTVIIRSHLEALDKLADLEANLADVHTAGILERLEAMEAENAALKAQLAEAHGDICENGHTDHAQCTEACACVGSGKSRLERLMAENDALKEQIETMQALVGAPLPEAPTGTATSYPPIIGDAPREETT